ncbi:MAG: PAS domain S-box protein [Deltaproteobacteria bacterium]|nr:PAS domain S-box protein [Deltaproteobacteria bacterium]
MSGDEQYGSTGWGHRIKEENRGLREKLTSLRKELGSLQRELRNTWKLLDRVPGSLILVQQEKVLFANETACKETGYTRNELLSLEVSDLLDFDSVSSTLSFYQRQTRAQPASHQHETCLKTKGGQSLPAELRADKILYRGKTAILFHIISLDQRKAQEKRHTASANAEILLRMASGFRQELDRYRRLLQEDTPGNPGPGVYGNNAPTSCQGIAAIREKESRLSLRLQCLAKTEYDPSELTFVGLKELIETAVDIACPTTNTGSRPDALVTMNTFLRAPSSVYGCGRELQEAFANLILNAVEALPDGGDVYLTTEAHSGFAHIYIQDNGVGMPEAIIEKIFDPFFTTKDGTWRGLGLSLSRAIIDRHQGEISVVSQERRGSTFVVKLPLARDVASLVKRVTLRKGLRDAHILIIGDEGVLTDILYTLFKDKCDGVTVVSSDRDGLRLLQDTRIDLIIADQGAFANDTSRIARRIKELRPDLPVVLINADKMPGSWDMEGKTGADLTMARPIDLDRFLSQVALLMEKGGAPE